MRKDLAWALRELIGQRVRVAHCSDKSRLGLSGVVLDETKNTFVLETPRGVQRVPKAGSVFAFPNGTIAGDLLLVRPEDRTKKLAKLARA